MAEELKIIIDADVSKAQAGLDSVSSSAQKTAENLTKVAPAANDASAGLDKIASSSVKIVPAATNVATATNKIAEGFTKVAPAANASSVALEKTATATSQIIPASNNAAAATQKMASQLAKVAPSGNAANIALLNTGRVLQDLPFGIIGIANNITPLIESLVALRTQAAVTGVTMRTAFLGALAGPGGIILAVSAITAALQFATIGAQAFGRGLGGAKKEIDEVADRSQKLKDAISGIFGDTAKEVTEVTSLIAVLQSETETRERKLLAIKELNKIAPETFNNLKLEGDSVKNLDQDYKNYLENIKTVIAAKIKQAQLEGLITQILKLQGVTLTEQEKRIANFGQNLAKALGQNLPADRPNPFLEKIQSDAKKTTEEISNIQTQIDSLFKDLTELSKGIKIKTDTSEAKKGLDEVSRKIIELAKQAERVFDVPLRLRFDDTDLDVTKLAKATEVLRGIRDFTIKARVDIDLPDIKELPKEQVERFFINVPDALQDAINKGIIEVRDGITFPVKLDLDPEHAFDKDIDALEAKFRTAGIEIPVKILTDIADGKLKGAELVKALTDAFDPEILKDRFKKATDFLAKIKIGVQLGNLEDATNKVRGTLGGISQEAGLAAAAINGVLTQSVENFIRAIQEGQNPIKAFFDSIVQGLQQVIVKLIQTAIQAAILNALFPGSGGFGSIFKGLLGFEKGGDPPVGRPSIVGERGPELIVPKSQMHVFSHEQSKSILSSSVTEYHKIKSDFSELKKELRQVVTSIVKETVNNLTQRLEAIKEFNNGFISIVDRINKQIETKTYSHEAFKNTQNEKILHNKETISEVIKSLTSQFKTHISEIKESAFKTIERVKEYTNNRSVNIERVVNNNFYSESFSSLKTMSAERIANVLNLPKFASGGAVFSPTLALLGEGFGISRSNPEFVGTREQLKGIQGGTFDINVNVAGDISFDIGKLALALNREQRSQLRTNGKKPF